MNQDKLRARVTIEGRVQGVFFRASTRDEATQTGGQRLGAQLTHR